MSEGPRFFVELAMQYRGAKILLTANKLGVFPALLGGPRTASDLAASLRCAPDPLERLLRALVALGILELNGGQYSNSELAREFLVPGTSKYTGNNLRFLDMLWDAWSHLEDVVRTGEPHRRLEELLGAEGRDFTREYVRGMLPIAEGPARRIAAILAQGPGVPARMLDVGAGPGAYALAMLERLPELHATLLDLPATLEVTEEHIRSHPARGRVTLRTGDYLEVDYGSGFDLVIMSHTTHDEPRAAVRSMLGRAYSALNPGGRIAIHDWVLDESGVAPAWAAIFSVNVMLYTRGGRVYSLSEYSALLEDAGFSAPESLLIEGPAPTTLILAQKDGPAVH
jgi:ubiquinone/menaquinone biosynthesis C-methylase UbiE